MGIVLNWSSVYPGVVDSVAVNFPVVADNTHDVLASHVNELSSAVVALEIAAGGFRTSNVADPLTVVHGDVLAYDGVSTEWDVLNSPLIRRDILAGMTLTVPDGFQYLVSGSYTIAATGALVVEVGGEVAVV